MVNDIDIWDVKGEASQTATDKGFWKDETFDSRFSEAITLIHSEISEAVEAHRKGNIILKEDSVAEELGDTVIRIFDLMDKLDQEYGESRHHSIQIMLNKMNRNKERQYKHGKRY